MWHQFDGGIAWRSLNINQEKCSMSLYIICNTQTPPRNSGKQVKVFRFFWSLTQNDPYIYIYSLYDRHNYILGGESGTLLYEGFANYLVQYKFGQSAFELKCVTRYNFYGVAWFGEMNLFCFACRVSRKWSWMTCVTEGTDISLAQICFDCFHYQEL